MPWTTPPGSGATVHIWNGYFLAERDRRWNAVRANASKANFDCILVPLGDGIDARYMTQLRCSAMALPTDGREPIIIADRRSSNEWVPNPWQTGREWAEPMAEALLDLNLHKARIGVAGLKGCAVTHCTSIDGVVNHSAMNYVMTRLPDAKFEDATELIGKVRFVKSPEELPWVRQSAEVAAAGVEELIKLAQPGSDAGQLWAHVTAKLSELRSEFFPLEFTVEPIGTQKPKRYTNPPIGKRLEKNTLITNQVSAMRGAQLTQACQPILLGKVPEAWKPVVALQKEVYEAGLSRIKPGTTFGELADFVNSFGTKSGMRTVMQLHGCGYGDDGPRFNAKFLGGNARDLRIEAGNAFVWQPVATSADEKIQFSWGGAVVMTEGGAEALFNRTHGMVEIEV
ncbi:MAG: M24 family metallopeptidase [Deltaproteobacteria bacterium]|nr:M24 family metallopeptidase [Deltaproteobacteria bacterium]